MKKLSLVVLATLSTLMVVAQNDIARVENIKGVYVFTDNTPLAEYDVIGEVSFQDDWYSAFSSLPPRYVQIRMGLVINAVLANREVEGIITDIHDDGTGTATMIKFKPNAKDRDLAKVNSYKNLLYFSDCQPVAPYELIKAVNGPSSYRYGLVRKHFLKKTRKLGLRNKGIEAVIVQYNKGINDKGQYIRFNK